MPRQNRVRPDGRLVAVSDRGLLWGNRGSLHDADGTIIRYSRGKNWVTCALEFNGRRRTLMTPGHLTELFFLDEATALAAGHRPCGECRVVAYRAFKAACAVAWPTADPDKSLSAKELDERLHEDRLAAPGVKRTYQAPLASLPDGTMVEIAGDPWLVHGDDLLAWTTGGYRLHRKRTTMDGVTVLTPRMTVEALGSGYRPELHPTARSAREGP
jgi:hypothetical protein